MTTITFDSKLDIDKEHFKSLEDFLSYLIDIGKIEDLEDYLLGLQLEKNKKENTFIEKKEVFNVLDEIIGK